MDLKRHLLRLYQEDAAFVIGIPLDYTAGVWCYGAVRDIVHGQLNLSQLADALLNNSPENPNAHPK